MQGITQAYPTIFVQIASYRDTECQWTVQNLYAQATYPERIFVGICWQYDAQEDVNCFAEPNPRPDQTQVILCDAKESGGIGWARALAQSLYRGEDYVLMIDSHMRFEPGWDEAMIAMLEQCPAEKPILSCYPPGYVLPGIPKPNAMPSILRAQFFLPNGGIRPQGERLDVVPDRPLPGALVGGGYMFTRGAAVQDVPYDPCTYQSQEEVSLALRFYTHGWDVFSPHLIVIYHLYDTDMPTKKKLHWEGTKDWQEVARRAQRHFDYLTGYRADLPAEDMLAREKFGLGNKRSLAEFEAFSGIDFRHKKVSDRALRAEFVPNRSAYRNKITIREIDGKLPAAWPASYLPPDNR